VPVNERVLIDVVVRDAASEIVRQFRQEIERLGPSAIRAGQQSGAGFDRITQAAQGASTRTTGLWQDASGHWRNSFGQFASAAEREMAGLPAAARNAEQGVSRATNDMGSGLSSVVDKVKGLVALMAAGFAVDKLKDFASDAINQASDIQEASTKLTAVFGDGTDAVNQFAGAGAKALGQSSLEVKNAAATFGVFGKAAGLAGTENAKFSTDLVSLSTDLASFYNEDPSAVVEALGAGLRGEAEPLRRFGILMDDATLRNKALAMGLTTTTKDALEPQQKVLAAQALIMEQTSLAQGDFARTSGGLANQQRILAAQWTDMKGKLGQAFLPAVTGVVVALNDKLMPLLDKVATAVPEFVAKVTAGFALLRTGDFVGGLGVEEDSALVGALLGARAAWLGDIEWPAPPGGFLDKFIGLSYAIREQLPGLQEDVKAAWHTLASGDFVRGNSGLEEDSPLIVAALALRDWGIETFEKLRGVFDTLVRTGKDLWPSLKSIGESLGLAVLSFKDSGFDVAGVIWDSLLAALQGIATLLEVTLVPLFNQVAVFMRENPEIVQLVVGAFLLYKGVLLGVTIAARAYAIATGIMTAATSLLTAVMNMNPFMKLVVALTALVAGFIWAYNNVDWFREMVDTAWQWIQMAFQKAMEFIAPIWKWLGDNIHVVGDFFVWLWQSIIVPAWNAIVAVISWAWNTIILPYLTAWWGLVQFVGGIISGLWTIVSDVFTWIVGKLTEAWTWIRDNVFNPLGEGIGGVGTLFSGLWTTVSDVWTWIGDKIQWVWDNVVSPIWEDIKSFISSIGEFFTGIWKGVEEAATWIGSKITEITKAISDFLGMDTSTTVDTAAALTTPQTDASRAAGPLQNTAGTANAYGKREGGLLTGPGSGTSDSIPLWGSNGEYIVRASETRKNLGLLEMINAGRYAAGGLVQAGYNKGYNALTGFAGPKLDAKKTAAEQAMITGPGAAGNVPYNLSGGVEQWRGLALLALQAVGKWKGMDLTYAIDKMLYQMQTESSGNPNAINLTDINAQRGYPSMGLLQVIKPTFDSNLRNTPFEALIANGQTDPWANMISSIIYGLNRYKSLDAAYRGVAYDNGGMWATGTSGWNTSGRTEAVLTAPEREAYQQHARSLAQGGGAATITIEAGAVQINVAGGVDATNRAALRRELEAALRDILSEDAARRLS